MSSSALIRLSGFAAVGAGVLLVLTELLYLVVGLEETISVEAASSGFFLFQGLVFLLAGILLLGGLVGFYASRSEDMGTLGLVGFLVAFIGSALTVGAYWDGTFVPPVLAQEAPELLGTVPPPIILFANTVSFALLTLGWLLFGLAVLRSRVYPRVVAVLLMVGAVLAFFPLPFSTVVFGLAVAWMGFGLLTGRVEAVQRLRVLVKYVSTSAAAR